MTEETKLSDKDLATIPLTKQQINNHYQDEHISRTIITRSQERLHYRAGNIDAIIWYDKCKDTVKLWDLSDRQQYEKLVKKGRTLYWTLNYFNSSLKYKTIPANLEDKQLGTFRETEAYSLGIDIDGKGEIYEPKIKQAVEQMAQFFCDELRKICPKSVYSCFSGGGIYIYIHHQLYYKDKDYGAGREIRWRRLTGCFNRYIQDLQEQFFAKNPQYQGLVKADAINNQKRVFKTIFSIHKRYSLAVIPLDPKRIHISFQDATIPLKDEIKTSGLRWYISGDVEESSKLNIILKKYAEQIDLQDYNDTYPKEIFTLQYQAQTKHFPPCIKQILTLNKPSQGATRMKTLLTVFLAQAGYSEDTAKKLFEKISKQLGGPSTNIFKSWFGKISCPNCKTIQLKGNGFPSLNLGETGICQPDELCTRIKSPLDYLIQTTKMGMNRDEIVDHLKDPQLMINVVNEIQKQVAGEEDTIIAETIITTTRLVKEAIPEAKNLFLSDKTGLGKDYVTKKTLKVMIPPENHLHVTKMSPEAFTYWHNPRFEPNWTWDDKVIHFEDINQSLLNCSTFKVMSSGGSHAVVVKDQQTLDIPINGKPVMILTSHHANPNDENLRRYPIGGLNSTEEQTDRIKDKIAQKYTGENQIHPDKKLINALHTLLPYKVIIPYAELIQYFFPSDTIMRTHFQRFLNYICASTVFHQQQREKKNGCLIATPDDYMIARMVLIYTTSNPKMIPLSKEYREILELLQIANEELSVNEIFLLPDFNHSKPWLYRNLPKLCATGIIAKGKKYDDSNHRYNDTYYFSDINARAVPTWDEILELIQEIENDDKCVKCVKCKNPSTEENTKENNILHPLKNVLNEHLSRVKNVSNRLHLTHFTQFTQFLRERDEKRFSKYYETTKNTKDKSTNLDDFKEKEPVLYDKIKDVKKLINDNPDNNYELILDKFGQDFIDKGIEQNLFFEASCGKKLEWNEGK